MSDDPQTVAHPLAELADRSSNFEVFTAGDGLPSIRPRDVDPNVIATLAAVARALHPDVARCALALAEGLRVPEGWTVEMMKGGTIKVTHPSKTRRPRHGGVRPLPSGMWRSQRLYAFNGARHATEHPSAQAAVDAAVRALGGQP